MKKKLRCQKCNAEIPVSLIASYMGSRGAGQPKNYTPEEKIARAERLNKVREKRWPKKSEE